MRTKVILSNAIRNNANLLANVSVINLSCMDATGLSGTSLQVQKQPIHYNSNINMFLESHKL